MINVLKLRKILGWLGATLPLIVAVLYMLFEVNAFILPACILLICYDGYDKQDRLVCTLAGIFGLCICLFPCYNKDLGFDPWTLVGTFHIPAVISGWVHNISAIIFFALLAYNSYFLFTKSSGELTAEKKKRNLIFKVCGIGMLASFIILIPLEILDVSFGTWLVEAIALTFFGASWLTKSQCYSWLFKDKE